MLRKGESLLTSIRIASGFFGCSGVCRFVAQYKGMLAICQTRNIVERDLELVRVRIPVGIGFRGVIQRGEIIPMTVVVSVEGSPV